jgi:hypothetical protein
MNRENVLNGLSCAGCAACCVAPDISTLNKPAGVPCQHLNEDLRCGIYEDRPEVCRNYRMDESCLEIQADSLQERVAQYGILFDLQP